MQNVITFTTYQLLIDYKNPSIVTLEKLIKLGTENYNKYGMHYSLKHKVDTNKSYYWLYAEYGKPLPHPDNLYDIDKQINTRNPRKLNQVELRNQLFARYDFNSNLLYLSNSQKIGFIEDYFKAHLSSDVVIKKIYKSAEEFLNTLHIIDDVCLVSRDSLFTDKSGLFDDANNILGLGNPDRICIDMKFSHVEKTRAFIDKFKSLGKKKENIELDQLICVGKDDKNIDVVFNTDSFANKIEIIAQKNEKGMYLAAFVEEELNKQIGIS